MCKREASKNVTKEMHQERIELDDTRLEEVAGSQFIPEENRYICDNCGTECDFVDVTHNYLPVFLCPKCGARYVAL